MQTQNHNTSFLIFFLIAFLVSCGMHLLIYYTYFRYSQRYAYYFVWGLFLCNLLFTLHHYFNLPYLLELLFSTCLGVSFLLFSGAIFYYIFLSPLLIFATKEQYHLLMPSIRYLSFILAICAIFYGLYAGLYKKPIIKNIEVPISRLQKEMKIIQISDLHINTLTRIQNLQKMIQKVNELKPDAIMLTGDIIDSNSHRIEEKIILLKNLKAKFGIYYILGNHEYYHNTEEILDLIRELGIIVLNNTSTTINIDSTPLINIIGITDLSGEKMGFLKPNIKQAILKGNPKIPSILLSHQPKVLKFIGNKKIELILSGHTHGGQIFPFNFLVALDQPYVKGLHLYKPNQYIYVSQGSSTWGPPMRLGSTSEITYITLKPQE
ncbi:metallophosphoesterase [Helicobacter sp. faydin-H20]|uniref:metallophosphoesterase n=1 Tax=Helicobacter anatolicus TaxID=2905874 RepID=UPI001E3971FE|nr:metallophosphoesterase [Helicobacter anatolicus]MCE3037626.1 metallophosphoesterase [Helicobacter anatolicus]